MRTFYVSIPPATTPKTRPANVLVFLHGVGEAFVNVDGPKEKVLYSAHPGELVKEPGLKNLFNHGVPKMLNQPGAVLCHEPKAPAGGPPFSHPIFKNFVTIAPQTFRREDFADPEKNDEMMDDVHALAQSMLRASGAEPKIALLGFSRGGFAALQLGARREVRAIVTMDAVAQGDVQPLTLGPIVRTHDKPFWTFFADYSETHEGQTKRITNTHHDLDVTKIDDFTNAPGDNRCKTLVPTYGSHTDRHTQVCNAVSGCAAVYEWILKRL